MGEPHEFVDTSTATPVRGILHQSRNTSNDCLILTYGAGANCNAPPLIALAEAFCASGLAVLRCDLPFRQSRPHGPPPRGSAERDQQGLRAAGCPRYATGSRASRSCSLGGEAYLGFSSPEQVRIGKGAPITSRGESSMQFKGLSSRPDPERNRRGSGETCIFRDSTSRCRNPVMPRIF